MIRLCLLERGHRVATSAYDLQQRRAAFHDHHAQPDKHDQSVCAIAGIGMTKTAWIMREAAKTARQEQQGHNASPAIWLATTKHFEIKAFSQTIDRRPAPFRASGFGAVTAASPAARKRQRQQFRPAQGARWVIRVFPDQIERKVRFQPLERGKCAQGIFRLTALEIQKDQMP